MAAVTASLQYLFRDCKFIETVLPEFPGEAICFHIVFPSVESLKLSGQICSHFESERLE